MGGTVRPSALYWIVEGEGRPVVLLHAGGLDSRMFEPDLSALARSALVVRYDRSGSGRSPSCPEPVDRIEELRMVTHMAVGERPVVLVGCSFGGQLAIDFALRYPRLVAGLLLVGPGLSGAAASKERRARMARFAVAAAQGEDALADAWLRDPHLAPHGFPPASAALIRVMLRDNAGLFLAPPAAVVPTPALRRLDRLAAAGHVLVGEHDDADNHRIGRAMTHVAPALQLYVVQGSGHFPMLERVGWLAEALAALVAELDARAVP